MDSRTAVSVVPSPLPSPLVSPPRPPAARQRAGDAERSAVCDQLAAHYAAGRLRPDELEARLDAAIRADTLLELHRLVSDLPQDVAAPVTPGHPRPERAAQGLLTALAVLVVVVTLGLAGLAVLLLGGAGQWALLVAGLVGGSAAALGGAALTHLVHGTVRASAERSAAAHRLT